MPEAPFTIVEFGDQEAAEPVVLVRAVQTCVACPSQWDAWDAQGRYFYLRHRNGRGSVDHFSNPDPATWRAEAGDAPLGQLARFYDRELPHDRDPMTELRAFCGFAGIELAEKFELTSFYQYIEQGAVRG